MKSYILHGEDQVKLREYMLQLIEEAKREGLEVLDIDWKKSNESGLILAARSQGLISLGQLIVVENFFQNNKSSLKILEDLIFDSAYLFLSNKTLTTSQLKGLQKKFVIQGFPIPKSIFRFLDSLAPGNIKQSIIVFEQSKKEDAEFILVMLLRQVRLLIWAKDDSKTLNFPSWQKDKFISQASKFTSVQLRVLHTKLLKLDIMNKKSQLPENLRNSLELLVASI